MSDVAAAPFWTRLGYTPAARSLILHRDLNQKKEPFDARVMVNRRAADFEVSEKPEQASWWWYNRYGRCDFLPQLPYLRFLMLPKRGKGPVAQVAAHTLDLFAHPWRKRPVGLSGLFVPETERRKGFAKTLVLEVFRRLREESIEVIEMRVREENAHGLAFAKSLGFEQVDTGVVYERSINRENSGGSGDSNRS